mmetsp:Transcript_31289/g.33614  ORF Transcript_31289/g.33614 Transcript_31289/m.33614 type:complete len:90 (+) Transcript_31289:233-502(+)
MQFRGKQQQQPEKQNQEHKWMIQQQEQAQYQQQHQKEQDTRKETGKHKQTKVRTTVSFNSISNGMDVRRNEDSCGSIWRLIEDCGPFWK